MALMRGTWWWWQHGGMQVLLMQTIDWHSSFGGTDDVDVVDTVVVVSGWTWQLYVASFWHDMRSSFSTWTGSCLGY